MFVVGTNSGNINEYSLSAPFDISNPSFVRLFSVSSEDTLSEGVAFNPAGTKMFVVGNQHDKIYEYALTTPVDLSKLLISESGSVNGTGTALSGASIETVGNSTSIEIKMTAPQLQSVIALTTPELDILEAAVSDVSGNEILASYDNIIAVTNSVAAVLPSPPPLAADNTPPTFESAALDEETGVLAITFDEIIANEGFDLSTAAYTDNSFLVGTQDNSPQGVAFSTNGTLMFVAGDQHDSIYEYRLTTPFDLSSSSYANRSFSVGSEDTSPYDVAFNPDGTKMFVAGYTHERIHEYTLSSPFNLDTASYANSSFLVRSQDNSPHDVAFNPDGTKMFVAGYANEKIYEYTLSTPFDVSSSSYTRDLHVRTQDNSPYGVTFNPAGTKMFVVGAQHDRVYEYTLTTPFDLSSSSYTRHFPVGTQDNSPNGVTFNPAGTKMFVVGNQHDRVYEYALSTPVDLSKLFISELASVNGTGTVLTGASIETVGNSASIEIKLTAPQLQSVIALTTPELDILASSSSI